MGSNNRAKTPQPRLGSDACALASALERAWDHRSARHPCGLFLPALFPRHSGAQGAPATSHLINDEPGWWIQDWAALSAHRAVATDPDCWRELSLNSIPARRTGEGTWLALGLSAAAEEDRDLADLLRLAYDHVLELCFEVHGPPAEPVRRWLLGLSAHGPREGAIASIFVDLLKILELTYVLGRLAGEPHSAAWNRAVNRLESPHLLPDGKTRGIWLSRRIMIGTEHPRNFERDMVSRPTGPPLHVVSATLQVLQESQRELWPWTWAGRLLPARTAEEERVAIGATAGQVLTMLPVARGAAGARFLGEGADAAFSRARGWRPQPMRRVGEIFWLLAADADPASAHVHIEAARWMIRRALLGDRRGPDDQLEKSLARAGHRFSQVELASLTQEARRRLPSFLIWLDERLCDLVTPTYETYWPWSRP